MNTIYQIDDLRAFILCWQIGFRNGLKCGDRPTDREWHEVELRHPNWITRLGGTELNTQEYANEVASHGKKVLLFKPKD